MGFFIYISEEIYKTVRNWRDITFSFMLSLLIYGGISYVAYDNWDKLFNSIDDKFYLCYLGPQIWHLFWILILHFALWIVYENKFEILERYKRKGNFPWEKDPTAWNSLYQKTFWNYVINQCLVFPTLSLVLYLFGVESLITKEDFPGFRQIFWQLIFFHFCYDLFLFIEHRLMHYEPLYSWFHKYHHEYNDVVGILGEYYHPVEFALQTTALFIGPKILGGRTHIFTIFLWQMTNIYENIINSYSGYNFPWKPLGILPFKNEAGYHYYHQDKNKGSYSFYYNLFDRIFGYDEEFRRDLREPKLKEM